MMSLIGLVSIMVLSIVQSAMYMGSGTAGDGTNPIMFTFWFDSTTMWWNASVWGPQSLWFGLGYGAQTMSGTYATIFDSTGIMERQLGNHVQGTLLSASITTLSNTIVNNMREANFSRSMTGASSSYYTFTISNDQVQFSMIWSYGSTATFDGTKHAQKASISSFTATCMSGCATTTTAAATTTSSGTTTAGSGTTQSGDSPANILSLSLTCIFTIIIISFALLM
jgi:hypothetical protein